MTVLGSHVIALVIDDWHLVDHSDDVQQALNHLLSRCPQFHIVLASRTYPSLPNITLLAARRQMVSINEAHLRFTPTEAAAVLSCSYPAAPSEEHLAALVEQTHGCFTGILLSYQTESTTEQALPHNLLPESQVYGFLAEQVLNEQTDEVRSFLLRSALLDELTPERCDVLLKRNNSRQLLTTLQRRHLFVQEINPGVLRYHPLFREFLQEFFRSTDPQSYHIIARQLADFYAAQGLWLLAFEWYFRVGDRAALRKIMLDSSEHLNRVGRLETLEKWLSTLTKAELDTPLLCLKARLCLERGRNQEAQQLTRLAEAGMQPEDTVPVLLLQAQLARVTGNYEQAIVLAERALGHHANIADKALAMRLIGVCFNRLGQPDHAIEQFAAALNVQQERDDLYEIAQLQRDMGLCYKAKGLLHVAEDYFNQADHYWASLGNAGLRAMSLNSKACVQHLAGGFHDAHENFATALQLAREAALPAKQAIILSCLGDLYCDLQLWSQAQRVYHDARQLVSTAHTRRDLEIAEIRLQLRQGKVSVAAQTLQLFGEANLDSHRNALLLLRAGVAYAQGQYQQALDYLHPIVEHVPQDVSPMDRARAYLLQAQVHLRTEREDQATVLDLINRAAAIADQLGHNTFLVIEMLTMPDLLCHAISLGWERGPSWLQRCHEIDRLARPLQENQPQPALVVRTLGVDQILHHGQPVQIGWQKARETFYYLLAHPDGATINELREAIWPDRSTKSSREALRTAIYEIRSALSRDLVELHGRQTYRLNRTLLRYDYDVERFLWLLDQPDSSLSRLTEALDLYRGPYLVSSENEWCLATRTYLERRYLQALHQLASEHEARREHTKSLLHYQRILAIDMFDEAAHAGAMRCYLAMNNRGGAISQYQMLRRALNEELGLETGDLSEAESLYRQILAAS